MQLGPRGKKIYFLIVAVVFGSAIIAVSMMNGRSPLAITDPNLRPPFGAQTALYFEQAVYRPSQMLFADTMRYYLAPPRVTGSAGRLYPLVVILHDENGDAPAARYLLHQSLAAFYPAFIVVPQISEEESWAISGGTNVRVGARSQQRADMVMTLVQDLIGKIPVDPTRIYLVGCGNGGTGVFRAAEKFPHLVTAGVVMSGRWKSEDATGIVQTPLWIIHGQVDQRTPARYMQNLSAHIRQAGGDVRFTEIAKLGQNCHDHRLYMTALWSWLFARQRADQLPPQPAPLPLAQ